MCMYTGTCVECVKENIKTFRWITYRYWGKKVDLFLLMLVLSSTFIKFYIMAIWHGFLIKKMIQLELIRKIACCH